MALEPRHEQQLAAYADEVRRALGDGCTGVVLYGSAAGVDWVAGTSDINTAIVLRRSTVAVLDALAPVIARWRDRGFALPVVLDEAQVAHARQLFPMELDDIQRQHRLLAGVDPFADLEADAAALRRECAQEAFGKLLRLRAFYLAHAADPAALAGMMQESVKSFLVVARHLLRLRGSSVPAGYDAALSAAESAVGALPAMRQVLARRGGETAATGTTARSLAGAYVSEAERLVAAVVVHCA